MAGTQFSASTSSPSRAVQSNDGIRCSAKEGFDSCQNGATSPLGATSKTDRGHSTAQNTFDNCTFVPMRQLEAQIEVHDTMRRLETRLDAHDRTIERLLTYVGCSGSGTANVSFDSLPAVQTRMDELDAKITRLAAAAESREHNVSSRLDALHELYAQLGASVATAARELSARAEGIDAVIKAQAQGGRTQGWSVCQSQLVNLSERVAACEETENRLRQEFADRSAIIMQRVQVGFTSFSDVRSHLDEVTTQLAAINERTSLLSASRASPVQTNSFSDSEARAHVSNLEARLGETEQVTGSVCRGLEFVHQTLLEVKSAIDIAVKQRNCTRPFLSPSDCNPAHAGHTESLPRAVETGSALIHGSGPDTCSVYRIEQRLDELTDRTRQVPALQDQITCAQATARHAEEGVAMLRQQFADSTQHSTGISCADYSGQVEELSGRLEALTTEVCSRLQHLERELQHQLSGLNLREDSIGEVCHTDRLMQRVEANETGLRQQKQALSEVHASLQQQVLRQQQQQQHESLLKREIGQLHGQVRSNFEKHEKKICTLQAHMHENTPAGVGDAPLHARIWEKLEQVELALEQQQQSLQQLPDSNSCITSPSIIARLEQAEKEIEEQRQRLSSQTDAWVHARTDHWLDPGHWTQAEAAIQELGEAVTRHDHELAGLMAQVDLHNSEGVWQHMGWTGSPASRGDGGGGPVHHAERVDINTGGSQASNWRGPTQQPVQPVAGAEGRGGGPTHTADSTPDGAAGGGPSHRNSIAAPLPVRSTARRPDSAESGGGPVGDAESASSANSHNMDAEAAGGVPAPAGRLPRGDVAAGRPAHGAMQSRAGSAVTRWDAAAGSAGPTPGTEIAPTSGTGPAHSFGEQDSAAGGGSPHPFPVARSNGPTAHMPIHPHEGDGAGGGRGTGAEGGSDAFNIHTAMQATEVDGDGGDRGAGGHSAWPGISNPTWTRDEGPEAAGGMPGSHALVSVAEADGGGGGGSGNNGNGASASIGGVGGGSRRGLR